MTERDFERIYDLYWSQLYGLAYNYFRDQAMAKEVVQEVFVNLWVKRDSVKEIRDWEAYLFKSVKNKIYDHFDKIAANEKLCKQISLEVKEETDCTKEELEYNETLRLINDEIDQLPDTTKTVFRLSRFDKFTNDQIASNLHLSAKAVEYHITQALKKLRLRLKETSFIDHSS